jgi:hypothetical protein
VKKWVYHHKWVLCHNGTVPIEGYRSDRGDGWVLHQDETEERLFRTRGKEARERSLRRMIELEGQQKAQEAK